MDIKDMADQLMGKLKGDNSLMSLFTNNPVKAVEKALGVDLPDEMLKGLIDSVKAKLSGGNDAVEEEKEKESSGIKEAIGDGASNIMGAIGGIFGKKD